MTQPLLAVAWLVGAVFRDRWSVTTACFHIPALFVVMTSVVWFVLARRGHWTRFAWLTGVIGATALCKALVVDVSWPGSFGRVEHTFRFTHWNVSHGYAGPDRLARALRKDKSDVFLLSEFPEEDRFRDFGRRLLPDAHTSYQGGMLLVSRFPFERRGVLELDSARAWLARIDVPVRGPVDVLAVDMSSVSRCQRDASIAGIVRWIEARQNRVPLLIVGDFNTPRDSYLFKQLRAHMRNAYELRGAGQWPYTWPLPCPLYAIDHAWLFRLRLYNYELRWSVASDHARQVMDLRPAR